MGNMKQNRHKSDHRRKVKKRLYNASKYLIRKLVSSTLSKDLRQKYGVRSMPIHKDDEVRIFTGFHKSDASGKVVAVLRNQRKIHIERIQREKINGQTVYIPIDPSNVAITKLKLTESRKKLLEKKAEGRAAAAARNKDAKDKIEVQ